MCHTLHFPFEYPYHWLGSYARNSVNPVPIICKNTLGIKKKPNPISALGYDLGDVVSESCDRGPIVDIFKGTDVAVSL